MANMRELIVPSIGMMLLLSPMNWVHKIGVAAVFSVPSGVIVLLGVEESRRKQQDDKEAIAISTRQLEKAKKLRKEVEAREHELKQIHGGMKTLSEANTEKGLILAELAAKKQELKSLQAQFDAKKEKVEADLAHLVNLKLETEAERDRIINQAKLEGEDKARDYIRSLEAQLQQLVDMEHATRLELAREKHELELEKLRQEKKLERDRIVWETTKEQEEAKLTTEWANWLQEKEELREAWKEQVQDEINQQIDGEVEQRVQAVLNAQITAKTIPLLEDIKRLKNQVATLRDRISGLLQEIAEIKKPQKFKGTEYNDLLGNQIIEWYWQKHHVGLNAKNRTWEGSTYILEVEPGQTHQNLQKIIAVRASN
ncbi:MAG: hypothetical protein ACREPR_21110 [Brasilonema sp.]